MTSALLSEQSREMRRTPRLLCLRRYVSLSSPCFSAGSNSRSSQDKALRSEASQPQVEKASDNSGGNLKQPSEDEVVWDDSNWEEPLDEDGKPYFDPVDDEHFNRVAIKYAEEHKGPIE